MQPENSHNEHKPYTPSEAPIQPTSQSEPTPHNPFASEAKTAVPATPTPAPVHSSPFSAALTDNPSVPDTHPTYAMQTDTTPEVVTPKTNVSDLTLYLVVLFSGLSVIASASYLAWTIMSHFLTEPEGYSLFDFSTFNIYILIYLVLFGTLNILASLRLNKRVKVQGSIEGAMSTVGAIWRALLVVWGVSALVGILYSPLSASIGSGEDTGKNIAIDIVSALFALVLIAGFYWRDVLLHKMRSALIPTIFISALIVLVSAVGAVTTLNPKEAKTQISTPMDYSSSFESYDSDTTNSDSQFESSSSEFDFSEPQ